MGKSFLTLDSVVASDSRSSICDDPVSAHASWYDCWAVILKADDKEIGLLSLQVVRSPSTSWPTRHKPCTDPFLTSVCFVAALIAGVNSGSLDIFRHLSLLWKL